MDLPDLPRNSEAERLVLAALFLESPGYEQLFDLILPDHFYDIRHREIFKRLQALRIDGRALTLVNVSCYPSNHDLDPVYTSSLIDGVPRLFDYRSAAIVLREMYQLRQIMSTCDLLSTLASQHQDRSESLIEQAVERFSEIHAEALSIYEAGIPYQQAGVQFIDSITDKVRSVFTGVTDLDQFTGGFHAGELIVFTAETGTGKTLFAQQTRRRACQDGLHTLYCSGEMLARHLIARELAAEADVRHWKMRRPQSLTRDEIKALVEVIAHECQKCRILDGELTIPKIRRTARQMKQQTGLDCVVIDYDELVEVQSKDEWEGQRRLIREAKAMAMELTCPVIVISQLRKALQGEDRKHPSLQRLYGSGAKIKHASIVLYIDREYVQNLSGDETKARVAILKSRDGRVAMLPAYFDIHKLRFASLHKEAEQSPIITQPLFTEGEADEQ